MGSRKRINQGGEVTASVPAPCGDLEKIRIQFSLNPASSGSAAGAPWPDDDQNTIFLNAGSNRQAIADFLDEVQPVLLKEPGVLNGLWFADVMVRNRKHVSVTLR